MAKRKADPSAPGISRYKLKNGSYTQTDGRGELFHPRRNQADCLAARVRVAAH